MIEDTDGSVFGALLSSPIRFALNLVLLSFENLCRESEHFYGTGESFLFTCRPRWNFYSWAGDNQVTFIKTPFSTRIIHSKSLELDQNLWNLAKICGENQKLSPVFLSLESFCPFAQFSESNIHL